MVAPRPDVQDNTRSLSGPTTASLRALISKTLISDSDLDAFCLDHFREVYDQFTIGMNRVQKVNLLLAREAPEQVLAALEDRFEKSDGADGPVQRVSGPVPLARDRIPFKAMAIMVIGAALLMMGIIVAKSDIMTPSLSQEQWFKKVMDVLGCDGRKARKVLALQSDPETGELVVKGECIDPKTGKILDQVYVSRPQIAVWLNRPSLPAKAKDALVEVERLFEEASSDMTGLPIDAEVQEEPPSDLAHRPTPPSPTPNPLRPAKDLADAPSDVASPRAAADDTIFRIDACTRACGREPPRPRGLLIDDKPSTPFQSCVDRCCFESCREQIYGQDMGKTQSCSSQCYSLRSPSDDDRESNRIR